MLSSGMKKASDGGTSGVVKLAYEDLSLDDLFAVGLRASSEKLAAFEGELVRVPVGVRRDGDRLEVDAFGAANAVLARMDDEAFEKTLDIIKGIAREQAGDDAD